jgi:serine/threonine-protein kinase RsbW
MGMSGRDDFRPPACEFKSDNLILRLDELMESQIEAVSPMVEKLMRVLKEACCPPEHEFAVEMALREVLANAVLHGNRRDPRKKVRVCCACEADRGILIVVKDQGEGFDPEKVPSPLVGENIHSEHGRGIYLLNLLMDEIRFDRGGTEIHIRKRPPAAG